MQLVEGPAELTSILIRFFAVSGHAVPPNRALFLLVAFLCFHGISPLEIPAPRQH